SEAKAELPGDGGAGVDLPIGEDVRRIVVRHELAGDPAAGEDGDEGQRSYPLSPHDGLQRFGKVGSLFDVGNWYRLGAKIVGLPGRVAVNRLAIVLGQASPSHKPHHVVMIEPENGCAVAAQDSDDRIQAGLIDFLLQLGAEESIRERV